MIIVGLRRIVDDRLVVTCACIAACVGASDLLRLLTATTRVCSVRLFAVRRIFFFFGRSLASVTPVRIFAPQPAEGSPHKVEARYLA